MTTAPSCADYQVPCPTCDGATSVPVATLYGWKECSRCDGRGTIVSDEERREATQQRRVVDRDTQAQYAAFIREVERIDALEQVAKAARNISVDGSLASVRLIRAIAILDHIESLKPTPGPSPASPIPHNLPCAGGGPSVSEYR